jgi:hypothetical protein
MNKKSDDWKTISQEENQIILEGVTPNNQKLPNSENLSNILELANKNLEETLFHYLTEDEARKKFGKKCEGYIKKNGLPCVIGPLFEEGQYMKGILQIQFKMHRELLSGIMMSNIENLSLYVFYAIIAHHLSKLGWEKNIII